MNLQTTFNHPDSKESLLMGSKLPRELYLQAKYTMICHFMFFCLCTFNEKIMYESTHALWDFFWKKMANGPHFYHSISNSIFTLE